MKGCPELQDPIHHSLQETCNGYNIEGKQHISLHHVLLEFKPDYTESELLVKRSIYINQYAKTIQQNFPFSSKSFNRQPIRYQIGFRSF